MQPSIESTPPSSVRGSFLDNIRLGWKVGLVALALSIGLLAVGTASLVSSRALNYHLNNLYDFMLIPITAINRADAGLADGIRYLELSGTNNYSKELAAINKDFAAVLEQYNTLWVTNTSPEFTAVLQRAGRSDLQAQELATLRALNSQYQLANNALRRLDKPDPVLAKAVSKEFAEVRKHLQTLLRINDQFALISNTSAKASYNQALQLIWIVTAVTLVLGIALALWIAGSITRRLGALEERAKRLQRGDLHAQLNLPGQDEVSTVASVLNEATFQLREDARRQQIEQQRSLDLQRNVSRFLDVAQEIAGGNLTRRGEVTEDALGNVVDAVNLTVEEISLLLKNVLEVADQVATNAVQIDRLKK
jgi:twitching motility protein PilJ